MKEKEDEKPEPITLKRKEPPAPKPSRGREVLAGILHPKTPKEAPPTPSKPKKVRFAHQAPCRQMLDFNKPPKEPSLSPAPPPREREAAPSPIAKPTPKPKENPFKVSDQAVAAVADFLASTPYHTPPAVSAIEDEDPSAYAQTKRKALNRTPKVLSAIHALLPPVLKHSVHLKSPSLLTGLLGHTETLQSLFKFWQQGTWTGCTALLHFNYSEYTNYGVPPSPDAYASVLELHRRAIRLEGALSRLTKFIAAVTERSQSLKRLSHQALTDAAAVLASGSGAFGAGVYFWAAPPNSGLVQKLLNALPQGREGACANPEADWLASRRGVAFTRLHPRITELDWGIPLLALAFKLREHFHRLEAPEAASLVLGALRSDTEDKLKVYHQELVPLALYGGRLTKYYERVLALASAFKALGEAARVDFPQDCKLAALDESGRMLGLDGRPSTLGHYEFSLAGKPVPLIPFPEACCSLQPLPIADLAALVTARVGAEEALINDLSAALPPGIQPKAVQRMLQGRAYTLALLNGDSHLSNRTLCLPPTASLPEAVYDPEVVFGA